MNAEDARRLIILDSGLRAERGHHANFTRLLHREARSRNWPVTVYSNREVSPHLRAEFDLNAHFATSPYDLPHEDAQSPRCADLENFFTQNLTFERELSSLDLGVNEGDLILIPTIAHNQLLGLARWLVSPHAPRGAHVAVMLLFSPGWDVLRTPAELSAAMYRMAFKHMQDLPCERLALLAETQPIADEFAALAGRPVNVAPWPTAEPEIAALRSRQKRGDHVTIGYLGYAKAERGIHLLPRVVENVLDNCASAKWFVQVDTFLPETVRSELDALQALASRFSDRLTVHRGSMPRDRFLQQLTDLDMVLLPYEPESYRRRGSALFSEAAMLGKPMIVPAETWMARQMKDHTLGGTCFDAFNSEAIAAAVIDSIANIQSLRTCAEAAAEKWTGERAAAAFLDRLAASVQSTPQAASGAARDCEADVLVP